MPSLKYTSGGIDLTAKTLYMSSSIVVRDSRGSSDKDVMSQKAVTAELEGIDSRIFDLFQSKLDKSAAGLLYLGKEEAKDMFAPVGDYALKSEIPSFDPSGFLTREDIPTKLSEFENDVPFLNLSYLQGNYYTISETSEILAGIRADNEAWLHNFYNKEEVDDLIKRSKADDDAAIAGLAGRVDALEAIDHSLYATKADLEGLAGTDDLSGFYTKSQTDKQIADAVDALEIDSYLKKQEAEETYQPKGNYLEEHQSLENYPTKAETTAEINSAVETAVSGLEIDSYLKKDEAENLYQPKGEYLTEHQSLENYMTIERAESEHAELAAETAEIDARLKVAEDLVANFQTFDAWQPGYYAVEDKGCEELLQHDACYHIVADVTNCRRDNFLCHFAPTSLNDYVWEFSGEPSSATFIKETLKNSFDLTLELDPRTKFVVAFALIPVLPTMKYWLRGVKITDADKDHVTLEQLRENYYDKEEIDEKLRNVDASVDLTNVATKDELKALETKVDGIEVPSLEGYATETWVEGKIAEIGEYDDAAISARVDALEAIDHSLYAEKSEIPSTEGLASETWVEGKIEEIEIPAAYDDTAIKARLDDMEDNLVDFSPVRLTDWRSGYFIASTGTTLSTFSSPGDNNYRYMIANVEGAPRTLKAWISTGTGMTTSAIAEFDGDPENGGKCVFNTPGNGGMFDKSTKIYEVEMQPETKWVAVNCGTSAGEEPWVEIYSKTWKCDANAKEIKELREKVDGIELPSLEGYATEEWVESKIAEIEIPEADTDGFVSREELERVYDDDLRTGEAAVYSGWYEVFNRAPRFREDGRGFTVESRELAGRSGIRFDFDNRDGLTGKDFRIMFLKGGKIIDFMWTQGRKWLAIPDGCDTIHCGQVVEDVPAVPYSTRAESGLAVDAERKAAAAETSVRNVEETMGLAKTRVRVMNFNSSPVYWTGSSIMYGSSGLGAYLFDDDLAGYTHLQVTSSKLYANFPFSILFTKSANPKSMAFDDHSADEMIAYHDFGYFHAGDFDVSPLVPIPADANWCCVRTFQNGIYSADMILCKMTDGVYSDVEGLKAASAEVLAEVGLPAAERETSGTLDRLSDWFVEGSEDDGYTVTDKKDGMRKIRETEFGDFTKIRVDKNGNGIYHDLTFWKTTALDSPKFADVAGWEKSPVLGQWYDIPEGTRLITYRQGNTITPKFTLGRDATGLFAKVAELEAKMAELTEGE